MSRRKFRVSIMAIIPLKQKTIKRELTMENQCTFLGTALSIDRYMSQREAHLILLGFHTMSYVNSTSVDFASANA